MFEKIKRSGKINTDQANKRKHNIAYYVIGLFTLALEAMLGINAAFLANQSVGFVIRDLLESTGWASLAPVISVFVSAGFGASLMCAGLWTFSGYLTTWKKAKAYRKKYAKWDWPQLLCITVVVGIMGLDYATLGFRSTYFGKQGEGSLMLFFGIMIPLVWILGLFMHMVDHAPREARLAEVTQEAEAIDTDHLERAIRGMDPDLLHRYLSQNPAESEAAIQEYYDQQHTLREAGQQIETQAMSERDQRNAEVDANNTYVPFLKAVPPQAGQNGRSA
jgi:hypothetical protein